MAEETNAIEIRDVHKSFRLPHEQYSSLKNRLLHIKNRKKGFENQHVLKGVSFEVKKGEFFGIVGRNGSGKSTLLKLMAGVYVPDSGQIKINGALSPFIELGVGFNAELTGRENVFMNGALLGFTRKQMSKMYDEIVEFAELEKFMDQKLKNYSSGMQVRLAFSIAIRAQGSILLLDEVLAVGDTAFQQKCYDHFLQLKDQKKTVVLISHNMQAIQRFCTRAAYVRDGHIISQGTPEEIANIYTEENVKSIQKSANASNRFSSNHGLDLKIAKQTDEGVFLDFSYTSNDESNMYIAISVIKDGASIAEIRMPEDTKLQGDGRASFFIDTKLFNGGVYQVSAVLCRWENRERLSASPEKVVFSINKPDKMRGAALYLENTWKIF